MREQEIRHIRTRYQQDQPNRTEEEPECLSDLADHGLLVRDQPHPSFAGPQVRRILLTEPTQKSIGIRLRLFARDSRLEACNHLCILAVVIDVWNRLQRQDHVNRYFKLKIRWEDSYHRLAATVQNYLFPDQRPISTEIIAPQ